MSAGGEKGCAVREKPPLKGEVPEKQTEEFRNADLGRFNVWRPMVVERIRGSKWLSALPTGSKWVQALPTRF